MYVFQNYGASSCPFNSLCFSRSKQVLSMAQSVKSKYYYLHVYSNYASIVPNTYYAHVHTHSSPHEHRFSWGDWHHFHDAVSWWILNLEASLVGCRSSSLLCRDVCSLPHQWLTFTDRWFSCPFHICFTRPVLGPGREEKARMTGVH